MKQSGLCLAGLFVSRVWIGSFMSVTPTCGGWATVKSQKGSRWMAVPTGSSWIACLWNMSSTLRTNWWPTWSVSTPTPCFQLRWASIPEAPFSSSQRTWERAELIVSNDRCNILIKQTLRGNWIFIRSLCESPPSVIALFPVYADRENKIKTTF